MKNVFSQKLRELRRGAGLSQEQLAAECGVSVQAVSKWECAQSYPDIELLVMLAERFRVTVDSLLRESAAEPAVLTDLPEDNRLRVVQCMGQRDISREEYEPGRKIPLLLDGQDRTVHVEIWGNAEIDGNVGGDAIAHNGNISCGPVGCDAIAHNGEVTCGPVGCDAVAHNGSVTCGPVGVDAAAGHDIYCGNIDGNAATQNGDIHCRVIHGEVHCEGNIIYEQ